MDINEIRNRIDSLDEELLKAFLERMRLSEQVARYKVENSLSLENKQREEEVLQKAQENAEEYENYAHAFFCTLIELSKDRQAELFPELALCKEMRQGSCQRLCLGDACAKRGRG